MANTNEYNVRKTLKKNVLDDIVYSKTQKVFAWIGLIVGLWGLFLTTVIILFSMTQGLSGPLLDFTDPTILARPFAK